MVRLDGEEQELVASFEKNEWRPVPDRDAAVERYQGYARTTFKKEMRVNIRISSKDLEALQILALEEGIPYQTLMASVLHKYISGRLVDKRG
ncbi:MAG: antitoxin [Chloroflexi bacterium]|nr:antitoxin [Chloroflexota bacterium]